MLNKTRIIEMVSYYLNIINFRRKRIVLGKKFHIIGKLNLHCVRGSITIGDNCTINSHKSSNCVCGWGYTSLYTMGGGKIELGNNVGISLSSICAWNKIEIGSNSLIGAGTTIMDTDFHPINSIERLQGGKVKSKQVKIGENVFVGARSIILKGVNIGNNSVIGAGSVVTKDVPPDELWAGNPARFIKKIG